MEGISKVLQVDGTDKYRVELKRIPFHSKCLY